MSPVSESIQPRSRYVRNVVQRPITDGAPPCDGIVEEHWPTTRHVTNPFLYFGASGPVSLLGNLARILRAVHGFHDLRSLRTAMMGEYFVKTDPAIPALRRGPHDTQS
jgi:hypothetical protein